MPAPLDQIVERLKSALDDRLVSVILYGSAATGDLQQGYSDVNVLCVLSEITPRELHAVAPVFRWWRGLGNPAPLLLTRHEFKTSTDCFAIEFRDIREQHRVLHGENLVTDLAVDDSFYRAQVEHELRAKLLRLRHKAAGVLNDRHLLSRLLADSLSTFCVLFRHALLLHGFTTAATKREIIANAAEHFQIHTEPFDRLFEFREGKPPGREVDCEKLLADYMQQISTVIEAVDRL
jgi:predicted nucleotidyltransferase